MAFMKLTFSDYKKIQSKVAKMSQKELSHYLSAIYKGGYRDGCEATLTDPDRETIDKILLDVAIKSTEGIGPVLQSRLKSNIDKLQSYEEEESNE